MSQNSQIGRAVEVHERLIAGGLEDEEATEVVIRSLERIRAATDLKELGDTLFAERNYQRLKESIEQTVSYAI